MDTEFADLLARAQAGDELAQGELLSRYLPEIDRFVRAKSGTKLRRAESVSDLVQTVCREVLVHLDGAEAVDEAAFRGWLYQVALHKLLGKVDRYRAAKRDPDRVAPGDGAAGEIPGVQASPSRHAAVREEIARLERAFDELPTEYRDVIVQVGLLQRSHRDVAADLGRSEDATRQLLSRARARLALLLRP